MESPRVAVGYRALTERLRTVARRAGFPAILCGAIAAGWAVLAYDLASPQLGSTLVVLGAALLLWGLERWIPYEHTWAPDMQTFKLDLVHSLVSAQLIAPLTRAGLPLAVAALTPTQWEGLGVWPTHWPLVAQLLLAIPLADFGVYWAHRAMHATEGGWRIHAVHHSPTRLYLVASARTHPANLVVSLVTQTAPLLILGIGPNALLLWAVFHAVNGLLQHSNADFDARWLDGWLATSAVHRRHHAERGSPCNFGNTTMLWDRLFGTFERHELTRRVGAGGYRIPEGYLAHLLLPWRLSTYALERDESGVAEPPSLALETSTSLATTQGRHESSVKRPPPGTCPGELGSDLQTTRPFGGCA